jgi:hypothetical protein
LIDLRWGATISICHDGLSLRIRGKFVSEWQRNEKHVGNFITNQFRRTSRWEGKPKTVPNLDRIVSRL